MESYAEDAIRDVVTDEIPPVLEEVLSDFSISEQFTVMDTTYELSSVPSDVHVDNNGLTLTMTSISWETAGFSPTMDWEA